MIFLKIINYGNCMKKIFSTFSALAIVAALSMFTVSCSSDENFVSEPQQSNAQTFTINIPASFGEGSRAVFFDDGDDNTKGASKPVCEVYFTERENVYVYNATKKAMLTGNLCPSEISDDGLSCVLTGKLKGTVDKGDELKLFYNLNGYNRRSATDCSFNYKSQEGSEGNVIDGAEAKLTVSDYSNGTLTTTGDASFKLLQSMFRFEFVDEKNTPVENLASLNIKSKNKALVGSYYPMKEDVEQNSNSDYELTIGTIYDYIYTAARVDEKKSPGDVLRFFAFDDDGNEYKGTKDAPKDGFKNGMYYYNSSAINLTKYPLTKPEIEWINVEEEYKIYPTYGAYYYDISSKGDKAGEVTLSGICNGYCFVGTSIDTKIHIKDLTALTFNNRHNRHFIWPIGNLYLDINGKNSITCDRDDAIPVQCGGTLHLSGNGTLTVTSYDAEKCGVWGSYNYNTIDKQSINYNNCENTDELDVSTQLAAEGYTVIRSARTDNADGTYTWTYTVKSKE